MSNAAISARLTLLRKVFAKENQSEFARRMKIAPNTWNNYEVGYRIGLNQALLLCAKTGVTLDWIYRGHEGLMPEHILRAIAAIEANEKS